jgi:hypothetical protein
LCGHNLCLISFSLAFTWHNVSSHQDISRYDVIYDIGWYIIYYMSYLANAARLYATIRLQKLCLSILYQGFDSAAW